MSKGKKYNNRSVEVEKPVELGYVEEVEETWKLASPFFASKFGGFPAWLDLEDLPNSKELACSSCDGPLRFLLQIYAPLEDHEETFHRSIFLFVCSKPHCCAERNSNKNWLAIRCQLRRENKFYSANPPPYDVKLLEEANPEKFNVKLCRICGSKGPQNCGSCHKINYCCKDHQTLDWKTGHKAECTDADFKPTSLSSSHKYTDILFKEYEIVIDTEVIPKASKKEKSDKQRLEEYEKLVAEGQTGTLGNDAASSKDLAEAASYKSDKAFNKFRKRINYSPDQILRYDRGGEPLWVSADHKMDSLQIPPCPQCKGQRVFEFQVMPQLLNYIGQDSMEGSLDWGTVAIYTCEKSCDSGPAYKPEFVWQQDFKETDGDGKNAE